MALIKELEEEGMVLEDFPFFNKGSPFYYNKKEVPIVRVESSYQEKALFSEEESINTLQL